MANEFVQNFIDAEIDAVSLSEFVYKPAGFKVQRRLAANIDTLQYYIDSFASTKNAANEYVATIPNIVNDAINNTAIAGGVLADTFLTATAYHVDTYARTQRGIRSDNISLMDFIPLALHAGVKSYTYADNIAPYMQKAVDYCTANNKELYCPAGGYMIDPATNVNVGVYLINNWGVDKNLVVTGAGQGLTVFREKAGATTIGGRYTKMLYVQCGLNTSFVKNFGHIKFSNMSLDKNGRSNTNPLRQAKIDAGEEVTTADRFPFEQAHILGLAGSGVVDFETVLFENIELIDKIGGGISFSSSPNIYIKKIAVANVISRKNSKVEIWGDGTFGTRGCVEIVTTVGVIDIINCDIEYSQVEPVLPSSSIVQRFSNISGGKIDAFEFTDKGGYSYVNITNLTCSYKLLTRGINANITNTTFVARDTFAEGIIKISSSTIKLIYDAATNKVTSLSFGSVGSGVDYGEMWLTDVDIVIDSPDQAIRPLGYGMGGSTGKIGSRISKLNNVRFDTRLEGSVDAYRNGDWAIANSYLYGSKPHILVGSATLSGVVFGGNVELVNNKYLGTGIKVEINKNAPDFSLKVVGTYPLENFFGYKGSETLQDKITSMPTLTSATKPTGFAPKGQSVINTAPVAGGYEKWIKVTEDGNSASWKGVGLIEA